MAYSHTGYGREAKRRYRQRSKHLRTKNRKSRLREVQNYIRSYKASAGCASCGEKEPCCLHIHHLDPSQKSHAKDSAARAKTLSKARAYLVGGVVLCANCHSKLHHSDKEIRDAIKFKAFQRVLGRVFSSPDPDQLEMFGTVKERIALKLVEVLEDIGS